MINIAVVGFGYWGPNLVRNFNQLAESRVTWVCDMDENKRKRAEKLYPTLKTTGNYLDVLRDDAVDAVIIATPVKFHYDLAKQAIESGKHVLLEKPMCASVTEAKSLIDLAEKKGVILMVDHTFLYTPSVSAIKQFVSEGRLGNLRYVDSTRINLGLFQTDVNVLWDLAPHDISICRYLLNERPIGVQAVGVSHTDNNLENIAYLTLFYPDNKIAHFNCSWISPVKIRQMLIGGDEKMIVFNDLENTEKIRIYDKGMWCCRKVIGIRFWWITAPAIFRFLRFHSTKPFPKWQQISAIVFSPGNPRSLMPKVDWKWWKFWKRPTNPFGIKDNKSPWINPDYALFC
jgi:predicted dehydrogenase